MGHKRTVKLLKLFWPDKRENDVKNVDCSNDALSLYSFFRERGIWITKNISQSYQSVYVFGIYVLFWVHQSDSLLPERVEKQFWKNAEKRMPHVDCILYFGHRLCSIGRGKDISLEICSGSGNAEKISGLVGIFGFFCSNITGGDFSVSDHKTDEHDNVFGGGLYKLYCVLHPL